MRILSCLNGLHPGGATLSGGRKYPFVFVVVVIKSIHVMCVRLFCYNRYI